MNTAGGYRAFLTPEEGGGFVVSFPDVPEALTSGETKAEALGEAVDCLIAALGGYIEAWRRLPKARAPRGEPIHLPSMVVAKLELYETMQREGLTAVALGERLGLTAGAVRRLLDLDHRSHIGTLDRAMAALRQQPRGVAEGDAAAKALRGLEGTAESWIEAVLDMGQGVPQPMTEQAYSGKLILYLSGSWHRRTEMAHGEGLGPNRFIVTTVAERVDAIKATVITRTTMVLASPLGASQSIPWVSLIGPKYLNRRVPIGTMVESTTAMH
jgi:antitoxin HicB